jgi:tetratricopeptide (TPR) repeat protein
MMIDKNELKVGRGRRVLLHALICLGLFGALLPAQGDARVEQLLAKGKMKAAQARCSQLRGFAAAWSWPLVGDRYLQMGCLEAARDCYQRGFPVVGLPRTWSRLAESSLERGDTALALERYANAMRAYETLIRDDRCIWNPAWDGERLAVRAKWMHLGGDKESRREQEKLRPLLRRAADYCRRLEKSFLDFICEEEVVETIDRSHPLMNVLLSPELPSPGQSPSRGLSRKRTLYDYRLVGESGKTDEIRILLRKSGKSAGLKFSELVVSHYRLRNMIYSPIELFAASQNSSFEYHLLEERKDESGLLYVVEMLPFRFMNPPLSFGKAWLRQDGRVERIELNVKSILNHESIIRAAQKRGRIPAISFIMDFGKVYRGIGFPSAISLRDAFLDENGRESLAADIAITYDRFAFFKVETRQEVREP